MQTSVETTRTTAPGAAAEAGAKRTLAVSPTAVEAMRAQLAKRGTPGAAIRVGIRGGGCSGFSYVIEFDDNPPRHGDLVMEFSVDVGRDSASAGPSEPNQATVRVHCDKKSLIYLSGSVLDWEKTLMFQGFKFVNPQEATRCGCGHSFTVG
jgi:iron-sulfur cluster assembly protein